MWLKNRVRQLWQSLAIKNKLLVFTGLVFLMIFLSVIFNVWVAKFSLFDFREILEENARSEEAVNALAAESKFFEQYMRGYANTSEEELVDAIQRTERRSMRFRSTIDCSVMNGMRRHGRFIIVTAYTGKQEMKFWNCGDAVRKTLGCYMKYMRCRSICSSMRGIF